MVYEIHEGDENEKIAEKRQKLFLEEYFSRLSAQEVVDKILELDEQIIRLLAKTKTGTEKQKISSKTVALELSKERLLFQSVLAARGEDSVIYNEPHKLEKAQSNLMAELFSGVNDEAMQQEKATAIKHIAEVSEEAASDLLEYKGMAVETERLVLKESIKNRLMTEAEIARRSVVGFEGWKRDQLN